MTKDLAILIGPDQGWLTTTQFLDALAPLARPVTASLLRNWELEADAYAAAWSDGGALARALVKLHDNNAAVLVPEPLYAALSLGHPPLARRLAVLGAPPGGG